MTPPTTVYLARHGEVHNPQAIYYGRLPNFRLSTQGRAQATAAGQALQTRGGIAALFCSPLERTTETASLIAAQCGHLSPQPTDLLLEVHSPWDGQPLSTMMARHWDLYTANQPPYEQPEAVLARVQTFVQQARQAYPGQTVVGVTHGDVIAFATLWAQGLAYSPAAKMALYQSGITYASLTAFTFITTAPAERPQITYLQPY